MSKYCIALIPENRDLYIKESEKIWDKTNYALNNKRSIPHVSIVQFESKYDFATYLFDQLVTLELNKKYFLNFNMISVKQKIPDGFYVELGVEKTNQIYNLHEICCKIIPSNIEIFNLTLEKFSPHLTLASIIDKPEITIPTRFARFTDLSNLALCLMDTHFQVVQVVEEG